MNTPLKFFRDQCGFGMIEVLVTLVILMLGLLGLAGTMTQSQRSEMESYQRVQALILLQDMADRLNANRKVASCYAFTTDATSGTPYLGTQSSITTPTCTAGTAAQQATAIQDMQAWSSLLQGAAEVSSSNDNVGAMAGARGCVTYDSTSDSYQVSIAWQGVGKTAAPPATWTCGKGLYGDEKQRRVVSVTLKIGNLS